MTSSGIIFNAVNSEVCGLQYTFMNTQFPKLLIPKCYTVLIPITIYIVLLSFASLTVFINFQFEFSSQYIQDPKIIFDWAIRMKHMTSRS